MKKPAPIDVTGAGCGDGRDGADSVVGHHGPIAAVRNDQRNRAAVFRVGSVSA